MKRTVLALAALTAVATAAMAGPIEERQALMKANAAALGQMAAMVKGEKPFDAAVAQQALNTLRDDAAKMDFERLFPEDSKTGGDTRASPKIWEDPNGFQQAIQKFRSDTAAAAAAPPADVEALKAHVGAIGANCGGCHQAYRL